MTIPRLQLTGITKTYPGVVANSDVSLTVMPGETHAVLGENGAGKSTLMKIIYGSVKPDAGQMKINGQVMQIRNPKEARANGISMVFQHFNLFDTMTVAENVWLGLTRNSLEQVTASIVAKANEYGLDIDPSRPVHTLSVGEMQRVEIIRALLTRPGTVDSGRTHLGADTAGGGEIVCGTEKALVRGLQHPVHQPQAARDSRTVHRLHGAARWQGDRRVQPAGRIQRIPVAPDDWCRAPAAGARCLTCGSAVMHVKGLNLPREDQFGVDLDDIHLHVRSGEVVGIAGVSGNGQKELLYAFSGEDAARRAAASTWARSMCRACTRAQAQDGPALCAGGATGPRGRAHAEPGAQPAADPHRIHLHAALCRWVDTRAAAGSPRRAADCANTRSRPMAPRRWRVRCRAAICRNSLSAARSMPIHLLIVSQPTWGVDVGAAAQIRGEILALARCRLRGAGGQ
jgi:ABC-type lipoprotein export system ATPase subunit